MTNDKGDCHGILAAQPTTRFQEINSRSWDSAGPRRGRAQRIWIAALLLAVPATQAVAAGPVLQPAGVNSTHAVDPFRNTMAIGTLTATINQSSLAPKYIGGQTDFDAYVATAVTSAPDPAPIGGIGPGLPGEIDFDLGSVQRIDAIAIWNSGDGRSVSSALREFDLLVSATSNFTNANRIGTFVLPPHESFAAFPADVFVFNPVSARFVRILAKRNDGFPSATRINEFAVRQAQSPLPVTPTDQIAFIKGFEGPDHGIYVINADGTGERAIVKEPSGEIAGFEWSPDGSRIVYELSDEDDEIYVVNADGTSRTHLTASTDAGDDEDPSWSPDGMRILFVSDRSSSVRMYMMNPDGSNVTQITSDEAYFPQWSPDGSRIGYWRTDEDGIFSVKTDGTGRIKLTNDPPGFVQDERFPRWSPDGTKMVTRSFLRTGGPFGGNYEIRVLNADGSGVRRITNTEAWEGDAWWSPDGSRFVFTRDSDVLIMNIDGTGVTRLASGGYRAKWSPDGSQIAFLGYDDPGPEFRQGLNVMNSDGSRRTRLTDAVEDFSWRPRAATTGLSPVLLPGSVANGASFEARVVPGSWAQVKGTNLAPVTRIWQPSDFGNATGLPTTLSGIQVKVNNLPAPVYFISPSQISFQVPQGVSGVINVQVIRDGIPSNVIPGSAAASAPGLFGYAAGTKTYAAAVFANSSTVVGDPSVSGNTVRKARPGDRIALYATGLTASPSGVVPAPSGLPGVSGTIGSTAATVEFAGLVGAGLFQINILVPNLAPGDYPLVIRYDGQASQSGLLIPIAP